MRAGSLRDALNALAARDGTKVLAGGHSLLPMMSFRLAQPARLVDIGDLAELRGIAEHRQGRPDRRHHDLPRAARVARSCASGFR